MPREFDPSPRKWRSSETTRPSNDRNEDLGHDARRTKAPHYLQLQCHLVATAKGGEWKCFRRSPLSLRKPPNVIEIIADDRRYDVDRLCRGQITLSAGFYRL